MKNVSKIEDNIRRYNIFDIIFFLVVCCGTVWLYMTYNRSSSLAGDVGDAAYAIFSGTARTLRQGELPLWYPYLWGGFSGVGHTLTQSFYPITLLLCNFLYNSDLGFLSYSIINWNEILHIIILCMSYYFLFRVLRFKQITCAAIAIAATFNSGLLGVRGWIHFFNGMVWLPLILAFAILFFQNRSQKSWGYTALAGIVLGIAGLADQAQALLIDIMFFGFLFLFYVFEYRKEKTEVLRIVKQFTLAIFIGVSICGISLFSALQFSINAYRFVPGTESLKSMEKMPFESFIEHKAGSENLNGIFMGADTSGWFSIGIFFAIFLILSFFIRNVYNKPVFRFAQFAFIFSLLYSIAVVFPHILYYIPFYSGIREPFLYAPYACMMAGILSAFGLDYILNNLWTGTKFFKRVNELYYNVPCLIIILAIYSILLLLPGKVNVVHAGTIFCVVAFLLMVGVGFFKGIKNKKVITYAILSILILGIGFDVYGFTRLLKSGTYTVAAATEKVNMVNESVKKITEKYHPTTMNPYRIGSWGDTSYPSNAAATLGYYDIIGYVNPIFLKMAPIHLSLDLKKRAQIENIKYFIYSDKADEKFKSWFAEEYKFEKIDTINGIYRTYDDQEPSSVTMCATGVDQGAAWLVGNTIEYSNKDPYEKIVETLNNPEIDLSKTALVNTDTLKKYNLKLRDHEIQSTVNIKSYKANSMEIQVSSNKPALLVTAEGYYPGWQAYVDGKRVPIAEVNYAFRGVPLDEGSHVVEFKYMPITFRVGIISFLLASVISLYLIFKKLIMKKELRKY